MRNTLLAVACLLAMGLKAQDNPTFKDRFFLGVISSYYLDFVTSPVSIVDFSEDLGGGLRTPYEAIPYQTTYFSLVSLGLEPRYNFYELNVNHALAVALPGTIGFGEATPANQDVAGMTGYLSIQLPLMLKYYGGTNATYKSKGSFGFSFGAGYEYNKLALIPTRDPQGIYSNDKVLDANKGWMMPVFSASVLFWRNNAPMEVSLKYGEGRVRSYSRNRYGQQLDRPIQTKANSIKLSFVYLLDQ